MYSLTTLLSAKRQEMLHELVPSAAVVAMLVNPSNAQNRFELTEVQAAAAKIGQHVRILTASSDDEIDVAFATLVEQRIDVLDVVGHHCQKVRDELSAIARMAQRGEGLPPGRT